MINVASRVFEYIVQYVEDLKQILSMLFPGSTPIQKSQEINPRVIIRMDDIQDNWLEEEQISIMDLFLSRNQRLSLGLIMNAIGTSSKILNTVNTGHGSKLFELGIHGWNHVDYTKLTEKDQIDSLCKSNEKMQSLFGKKSDLFIAPFGLFNSSTTEALKKLNIKILSANLSAEVIFNGKKSIFSLKRNESQAIIPIFHLPMTVPFKIQIIGIKFGLPLNKILTKIRKDIAKYGYAVVVVHPQDLVGTKPNRKNAKGVSADDLIGKDLKTLSLLIDALITNRIETTSFAAVAGIE